MYLPVAPGRGEANQILPVQLVGDAREFGGQILSEDGTEAMVAAFRAELAKRNYQEGANVRLHIREWDSNAEEAVGTARDLIGSCVD